MKRILVSCLSFVSFFGVVGSAFSGGSPATLVPGEEIVVPSGTGAVERALNVAAATLARAYKEGTGKDLKVVTQATRTPSAKAILLGAEAAKAAGFDLSGLTGMENVIAEKNGSIYLFGNDRPGYKKANDWMYCVLPSVRALTRFMEGRMNVRFLMPGDVGMDVPKLGAVELPEGTFDRELPKMEIGNGRFHGMMYDIANNIFGSGSCRTYGGHTYPVACSVKEYGDTHPEYFALRSGKRASKNEYNALCISNPAVEELIVAEILRQFDAGYDLVELGQNDGVEYCECSTCAALGKGLGYGEQFWVFHRRIAERLYKLHPDKKVLVTAYSVASKPPQSFKGFPPNVMVEIMSYSRENFARWNAFGVPNGYTTYIYLWGEYPRPGFSPKRTFEEVADVARTFVECGVKGIYRCGYGELFGTEGPAYYVFNRLLGDPSLDPNQLADEYFTRAYGPAAKPMAAFFRQIDARLKTIKGKQNDFGKWNALEVLAAIYSPSTLATLEASLAAGERLVKTPKQKQRIALTRLEFDYARHLATIAHLYHAYQLAPTPALFNPLADAVLARNAFIDNLCDSRGYVKPLPGWSEIPVFGRFQKPMLMSNGFLGAKLGSPYSWDVAAMREKGTIPDGKVKALEIARAATRPTLAAFKAGSGPWAASAWNELIGINLQAVQDKTRFKVLHDEKNLYFGIETTLADSVKVSPVGFDGDAWQQDCLEVFIDPTGLAERWYHLTVNAAPKSYADAACGLITDQLDPKFGQEDASWNGKWAYAVDREKGVWRTVIGVPFATLGVDRPAVGETWKLNVGREAGFNGSKGLSIWNPNAKSAYNLPDAYGKGVFK